MPRLTGRLATTTALAGVALMVTSGFLIFAAAGFSAEVANDPALMVAKGSGGADLIRWACIADLLGYLLLAPLAVYFYDRFKGDRSIAFYTLAGLLYVLIGATGAVMLGTAGPPLMRAYQSAAAAQREAIAGDFVMLNLIVVRGLWQTLEGIPAAVWLLGVSLSFFRTKARRIGILLVVLGAFLALVSLVRLLGP